MAISVVVNLGILGVFKYFDFFVGGFCDLVGAESRSAEAWLLHVVLPVGISFYTFQSIGYTVDVYRERLPCQRSFLDFALYVSFFPQLVAGPIERAERLLPQISEPRRVTRDGLESGAWLIAWGLFKKVFIADALAHPVDAVFAMADPTGPCVYLALVAFAVQIYCDFSGYTDIARGVSRWLGFELMENFDRPYFAASPAEFWRRWHISLSTWLRDYLYVPLGGNRHGSERTYRNLLLTMVLGGLWHGARLNFLFWGLYHGLLLALQRAFFGKAEPGATRRGRAVGIVLTFHLTLFGWLLFRVETMGQLARMVRGLVDSWGSFLVAREILVTMVPLLAPLLLVELVQGRLRTNEIFPRLGWPVRAFVFGLLLSAVLLLNRGASTPFLYFQF